MAPVPFFAYPKIAETPSQWEADEAAFRRLSRVPWVVTEKIHGANFCVVIDRDGLHPAKRKQLLDPGEDFFAHRRVLSRVGDRLTQLGERLRGEVAGVVAVLVYGELFGGAYPHPDVPPVPGVQAVQTGVWYTPDVELCVYDIALVTEGASRPTFIDDDAARAHFAACDLLFAEPLATCSYRDALAYQERFMTTVPGRLGLPPIADNLAEGVVIRPQQAIMLETARGPVRPLLKKKIAGFAEDDRYDGAKPWQRPREQGAAPLDIAEWRALSLLTPARVDAAISKVGRPGDQAGWAAVEAEVLADLREALSAEMGALSADERALLGSVLIDAMRAMRG